MLKIKELKLPKSRIFYFLVFLVINWSILRYVDPTYYTSVRWLLWRIITSTSLLFFVWFSYSYIISRLFKADLEDIMKKDIVSLLPLISLLVGINIFFDFDMGRYIFLMVNIGLIILLKIIFLPNESRFYLQKKFCLAYLIFIITPSFFLIFNSAKFSAVPSMSIIIYQALIFLLILVSFILAKKISKHRLIKKSVCIIASVYYMMVSFIVIYWMYTGNPLDIMFFIDSRKDIISTGIDLFGLKLLPLVIMFALFYVLYQRLFMYIFSSLENKRDTPNHTIIAIFIAIIIILSSIPPAYGYILKDYDYARKLNKARAIIQPIFTDTNQFITKSDESVFILQLESGNALALFGNMSDYFSDPSLKGIYLPRIHEIAKQGVLIPFIWSNSMQTKRAQENIFCGINNNIGESLSYHPENIKKPCIASIMAEDGYKTIIFRADDLTFANAADFLYTIGFEEVHREDIMNANDTEYPWGYDDCMFYKRAFEYLRKNYPDPRKLFVVIEVSSHHYPWDMQKGYENLSVFDSPDLNVKKYLNSYQYQDYCASEFFREFQDYMNHSSHLFIVHDTSFPVGVNGVFFNEEDIFNDNYLTTALYIPPKKRASEFRVGKEANQIFSLVDLMPTIFDILNNMNYNNSFAFALRIDGNNTNYEDCHLLVQPYRGGKIAVIRGNEKYVYYIQEKKVVFVNLTDNIFENNPMMISDSMSYNEFKDEYYCERYKNN